MFLLFDNRVQLEDLPFYRHWHPDSEPYTGGDSLATALADGWQLTALPRYQVYRFDSRRHVHLYFFELERLGEHRTMPVLANPFVERLIRDIAARFALETQETIALAS